MQWPGRPSEDGTALPVSVHPSVCSQQCAIHPPPSRRWQPGLAGTSVRRWVRFRYMRCKEMLLHDVARHQQPADGMFSSFNIVTAQTRSKVGIPNSHNVSEWKTNKQTEVDSSAGPTYSRLRTASATGLWHSSEGRGFVPGARHTACESVSHWTV